MRILKRLSNVALRGRVLLPTLVVACLALPGHSQAVQCVGELEAGFLTPPVSPPDPVDRFAIADLISHFYWARDQKVTGGLQELFTDDAVYELCTAGGAEQLVLIDVPNDAPEDVDGHLGDLNAFLNLHDLDTRHFVSNLILHQVDPDTVDGKAAVLVVLHNAYSETPEFDYTALLKLRFVRDANANWRIASFLVLGDTALPVANGIRGR